MKITFALLMAVFLIPACGKDDKTPEPSNRPPEEFNLVTVRNEESQVELLPEFPWNPAVDPDGDKVAVILPAFIITTSGILTERT